MREFNARVEYRTRDDIDDQLLEALTDYGARDRTRRTRVGRGLHHRARDVPAAGRHDRPGAGGVCR